MYRLSKRATKRCSRSKSLRFRLCIGCHVTHHVNWKKNKAKKFCTQRSCLATKSLDPGASFRVPALISSPACRKRLAVVHSAIQCVCVCVCVFLLNMALLLQQHSLADKRTDMVWTRDFTLSWWWRSIHRHNRQAWILHSLHLPPHAQPDLERWFHLHKNRVAVIFCCPISTHSFFFPPYWIVSPTVIRSRSIIQ